MHPLQNILYLAVAVVLIIPSSNSIATADTAAATTTSMPIWFEGYYAGPSTPQPINCGTDSQFVVSETYASCCHTSLDSMCTIGTECIDTLPSSNNGQLYYCGSTQTCYTMTIFQTSPFGGPSTLNIFCEQGWTANTIYRELPAQTTSSSTTSSDTSATSTSSPSATSTSQSTILIPATPPSPATTQAPTPSPSKAWIAGAVIGSIVGISLIYLAFWIGGRRGKKAAVTDIYYNTITPKPAGVQRWTEPGFDQTVELESPPLHHVS